MSKVDPNPPDLDSPRPDMPRGEQEQDDVSKGPNLLLIYSLLGLALVIAVVLAAFIVLPFYQRR
jgi:hypothetical protein